MYAVIVGGGVVGLNVLRAVNSLGYEAVIIETSKGRYARLEADYEHMVVHGDGTAPSKSGTLVYLNGGDDLAVMLARVEPAGGTVAVPKTDIGSGFGFFAHFIDTEGNRVGLHSMA